jgi:YHS domain-containing protein
MKRQLLTSTILALAFLTGCSRSTEVPQEIPPEEVTPQRIEASQAKTDEQRPEFNLDEYGRALRGYDPVAYLTESKATLGNEEISYVWDGVKYLFTTEENRDAFSTQPQRYLPAHGGYCTFGIVLKRKFDGDPTIWEIYDDRLHIFLNDDVRQKFLSDEGGNFAKVKTNWPLIRPVTAAELTEQATAG